MLYCAHEGIYQPFSQTADPMAPLTKEELLSKLDTGESLEGVEIGDVNFTDHRFENEPNFSGAIFQGMAKFLNTYFNKDANFESTQFIGTARAIFLGAVFYEKAIFIGTIFKQGVTFSAAQFGENGGAYFTSAKFNGKGGSDFSKAEFIGKEGAIFNEAEFSGAKGVTFFQTKFRGKRGAYFRGTKFAGTGEANFSLAEFTGEGHANFEGAQFAYEVVAKYYNTEFSCEKGAIFSFVKISDDAKLRFDNTIIADHCLMEFTHIENPGNLIFIDIKNLGTSLFQYTDVEKIEFKNVKFRESKGLYPREIMADEVWNEVVANKNDERQYDNDFFRHVEILYRKLKVNFENQRDYARAGDFHYGELEMKLKQGHPFFRYFSLTFLYKLVSGYGEKWLQSLVSFMVMVLLFSGLNLFSIEPVSVSQNKNSACSGTYEICAGVSWLDSALFTFQAMTLQRWDKTYRVKPENIFGRFLVSIQYLLGPTLIALMILAIRRQFKR